MFNFLFKLQFFCFLSMFLWAADTVLQLLELKQTWSTSGQGGAESGQQPSQPGVGGGAPDDGSKYPAVHY
jgi:hypothetical protein